MSQYVNINGTLYPIVEVNNEPQQPGKAKDLPKPKSNNYKKSSLNNELKLFIVVGLLALLALFIIYLEFKSPTHIAEGILNGKIDREKGTKTK